MEKSELKREIYNRYHNYRSNNYSEHYIPKFLIQEGYKDEDVQEVMDHIYDEKRKASIKSRKYDSAKSVVLYSVGTIVMCFSVFALMTGGLYVGICVMAFAVSIWIEANN